MAEPLDTLSRVTPSAAPSDADISAWQSLPRDEQLRRLQATLNRADCVEESRTTMNEILRRAQAASRTRHG